MFIASSVGGPVLGGVFAEYLHWSLIFWINLPLGLAAFAMSWFQLAKLPQRRHPHRLDIAGALLLIIGSSTAQLALSWGGERYAWSSPPILALLAAALVAWALFAWRTRTADEPLIPLAVLANPIVRNATLSGAFGLGGLHRAHNVPADLFRGRARPHRRSIGPRAHSAHHRHGDRARRSPAG